jgi:hypothetical protein
LNWRQTRPTSPAVFSTSSSAGQAEVVVHCAVGRRVPRLHYAVLVGTPAACVRSRRLSFVITRVTDSHPGLHLRLSAALETWAPPQSGVSRSAAGQPMRSRDGRGSGGLGPEIHQQDASLSDGGAE